MHSLIEYYLTKQKEALKDSFNNIEIQTGRKCKLTIIQVGNNYASNKYIKGKIKDGKELGVDVELLKFPDTITEKKLITEINKCNKDDLVDGIIVQLPLPSHINENKIKLAVNPVKDVDGFHPLSEVDPCTPKGICNFLKAMYGEDYFKGANALIIGRSNIVGKPMAKLLLSMDCNTTILHSKTKEKDKKRYLKNADIIVVATGHTNTLTNKYKLRRNCIVVDVGINRDSDGKLVGDCQPNLKRVALQTPVPGGVGLLTRIQIFVNLLQLFEQREK